MKDAAWANGIGKTVLNPCITSLPIINGIFNLDFVIAIFCAELVMSIFHEFKTDPIYPFSIFLAKSYGIGYYPQLTCCNCPNFYLMVIILKYFFMAA